MKLLGKTLTPRRIGILMLVAFVIDFGIDMIYNSCFYHHGQCNYIESRQPVVLVVALLWWAFYLWTKDVFNATYPLEKFKNLSLKKIKYIRIDLIQKDDTVWINEIKKQKSNKEELIAYSKEGSLEAKKKAITLGLKDTFIDFLSEYEVERRQRQYRE